MNSKLPQQALYEKEIQNNAQLQSTLNELKVATIGLESKFSEASHLVEKTQETEEMYKTQARELSVQVAQLSSQVIRLTGQLVKLFFRLAFSKT